jgi:DNA-binding NarL/FixJ family response regulator
VIRVGIVDDQPLVREGFHAVLSHVPDVQAAWAAVDGLEAVSRAATDPPDVILMDIRMPHLDGIEATRRILGAGATSRVIILTTFDLDEYVYAALQAGASAFLLKDVTPEALIDAIRVIAGGDALLAPTVTRRLIERFVDTAPVNSTALSDLTERECEILGLVARGLSNAEIATAVHISAATAKTHVGHLLAKLQARDRAQLVVVAYETGLVQRGTPTG